MTQNATLIFDSLFLHDTQMTDLEREQTGLRKLYLEMTAADSLAGSESGVQPAFPRAPRTFNFAPPFCPLPENEALSGKLTIGAPVAMDGWIVRPVSSQNESGDNPPREIPVRIPGYPQFPYGPSFILGYAGDLAESLLARAADSSLSHTTDVRPAPFSVSARYRAALTLEIACTESSAFSCIWTVGPERWKKA